MDRVPGHAWLMVLAAGVLVLVATAVPLAPNEALARALGQGASHVILATHSDLWRVLCRVAGAGALVITGLLLLLFFYRRRLYILFWTGGWLLVAASMFLGAPDLRGDLRRGDQVRRLAVSRHPQRAVLCRGLGRLSRPAARTPWLCARLARRAVLVRARADSSRHLGRLRARPHPDRRSPGGCRRRTSAAAAADAILGAAVVGVALLLIASSHMWTFFASGRPAPGIPGTTTLRLQPRAVPDRRARHAADDVRGHDLRAAPHQPAARGSAVEAAADGDYRSAHWLPQSSLLRRNHRPRAAASPALRHSDVASSSSTSIASRRSTIRSATMPAIASCAKSRRSSSATSARPTTSSAGVATSS